MLLHYLKISLRNLRKYKAQTAISICAMAVSITLMAIVSSLLLAYKPTPLLSQPYADRIEEFAYNWETRVVNHEDQYLILNHQFKSVEEMHLLPGGVISLMMTTQSSDDEERSLMTYGTVTNKDNLKFFGIRSAISGKQLGTFSENEIVISDRLAKRLFDGENPIGKTISLQPQYSDAQIQRLFEINKGINFTVKDVIEQQTAQGGLMTTLGHIYLFTDEITDHMNFLLFLLKEGSTSNDLMEELKQVMPNKKFMLVNVKTAYDESKDIALRKGLVVFLFLFVLVTFFNYIRQQTQLFCIREREVALRTTVGCKPGSLYLLFGSEVMIVLLLTLVLTLFLILAASAMVMTDVATFLKTIEYSLPDAIVISLFTFFILMVIGLLTVVLTVRRIRRDQTGLALRMRPLPKHGIRNVGLTIQMTVSILFTALTVWIILSVDSIKDFFGIPDDAELYQRSLTLDLEGETLENMMKIYDRIEALESVDKVFAYRESMGYMKDLGENPNTFRSLNDFYTEINQTGDDMIDFFNIKIDTLPGTINPERHAAISESLKQWLIEKGLWNGKTITLPYRQNGIYEILGTFDKIPLHEKYFDKYVIVTDHTFPYTFNYHRIILPKKGAENEAKEDIMQVIKEIAPARIDIKTENYLAKKVADYNYRCAVMTVIYILAGVSLVTTMASIYAGVSLDARRRRKEMALRKLNGATRRVIALIFSRIYAIVIFISAVIALPLYLIFWPKYSWLVIIGIEINHLLPSYAIALILIIVITFLTIFWKIRDIMKADPIEYLKD